MENANVVKFILILTATVALGLTGLRELTYEQAQINEDIFNKRAILLAIENQWEKKIEELSADEVAQVESKYGKKVAELTEEEAALVRTQYGTKVDDLSDEVVLGMFADGGEISQVAIDVNGNEVDGIKAEDIKMEKEKKKDDAVRVWPLFIYEKNGKKTYIVSVRGKGLWDEIWGNIAIAEDLNTVTGAAFDHKGETPGLGAEIKDNPSFRRQFSNVKLYKDGEYVSINVRKGGAKDKIHEVDGISGATVTADGVTDMLYDGIKYYEPYLKKIKE